MELSIETHSAGHSYTLGDRRITASDGKPVIVMLRYRGGQSFAAYELKLGKRAGLKLKLRPDLVR